MSDYYAVEFTAPQKDTVTTWRSGAGSLKSSPKYAGVNRIDPAAPFSATIEAGPDCPVSVIITAGNWPSDCARAVVFEMEGSLNDIRLILGEKPYTTKNASHASSQSEEATRRITVTCDAAGGLRLRSFLTDYRVDLLAMSTEGVTHIHKLFILPGIIPSKLGRATGVKVQIDGKQVFDA